MNPYDWILVVFALLAAIFFSAMLVRLLYQLVTMYADWLPYVFVPLFAIILATFLVYATPYPSPHQCQPPGETQLSRDQFVDWIREANSGGGSMCCSAPPDPCEMIRKLSPQDQMRALLVS